MLYSSMYSYLNAMLRDELGSYEMKNPRNGVDLRVFAMFMRFNKTS
ncbi:hypothetical protein FBY13_101483 [Pantoea sp. SJZ147]|nr:hypothetical protein FBY13_101483 [Pantoea sp. SJZ147]